MYVNKYKVMLFALLFGLLAAVMLYIQVYAERPVPPKIFGEYRFVQCLFFNPLSSAFPISDFSESFKLSQNDMKILSNNADESVMSTNCAALPFDRHIFTNTTMLDISTLPIIGKVQRYAVAYSDEQGIGYELYIAGGVTMLVETRGNDAMGQYIWSVYEIEKM